MNSICLHIDVPKNIFSSLDLSKKYLQREMAFLFAAYLYRLNKISLSKASDLAGMHRYDFENKLASLNIPISLVGPIDVNKELSLL